MKITHSMLVLSALAPSLAWADAQSTPPKGQPFIGQISDIDVNRSTISRKGGGMNLVRVEKIRFEDLTSCNEISANVNWDSLGMKAEEYKTFLRKTWAQAKDGDYFKFTTTACDQYPYMITKIEHCTAQICGAKYTHDDSIIWLNSSLEKDYRSNGLVGIKTPLTYDKQKKLWKVVGYYSKGGRLSNSKAIEGYTNDKELNKLRFVGEFKQYFRNGKLQKVSHFDLMGTQNKEMKLYFKTGQLHQTAFYKNGEVDGPVVTYHANGVIESQEHYHNGKHDDGLCKHYDEHGKLSRVHTYKNGFYEGDYIDYYPSGKEETHSIYKDGHQVSKSEYYPTGTLKFTLRFDGNKEIQTNYNQRGKQIKRDVIIHQPQRAYQAARDYWYDDGTHKMSVTYDEKVRRDGEETYWYPNGKLKKKTHFVHGDERLIQNWNKNGQLVEEQSYFKGKKDGRHRKWDPATGQLIFESRYEKGKPTAPRKYFDPKTADLIKIEYLNERGYALNTFVDGHAPVIEYKNNKVVLEQCGSYAVTDKQKKAANNNDANAQYALGEFYDHCNAIDDMLTWYQKSADNHNDEALNALIRAYDGYATRYKPIIDYKKAWTLKEHAAKRGMPDYLVEVGFDYLPKDFAESIFRDWEQEGYVKPDPAKALQMLSKAANLGNERALILTGLMYQYGIGVEASKPEAKKYFVMLDKKLPKLAQRLISGLE
ncbi:SEL1-like repeat protein [Vibrio nitrifigilis]|uniref:SEL1-like repeat protein n=1 Tax=Vibrio nitrifigilis TaxID=2789781 RepID=A0ABS0GCK9_9VIBR|nr:SEL1-like repeat protein [Vibrio nitrifigilis]MBF9000149.1 SEL1-like repeat protein [Vibrio nitrifigilis]